jgi:hypothetical protein
MSITRNRELSQFGSFVYIDNNSQEIGIATESLPYVGIGTTNPTAKLTVSGDTNLNGNLTVSNGTIEASSYTLNGNPIVDATLQYWISATNTVDIYRNVGNLGIGTSTISEKLTVLGNVSAGQFISTVSSGTAPLVVLSDTQVTNLNASFLRGKVPPSGDIVGTTDSQTLSSKTLTSPILNSPTVNSVGVAISGSSSGTTIIRASASASGIVTVPATNDILVGRNTSDTLTNKTIAAGINTITGLTNSNLSGSAAITNANLANSTISGVSLGSTLSGLSFGTYLSSSGSYDGSTARTVSVAGTSVNTANTLVARDASGDFTAGTANVSILNATGSIRISNTSVVDGSRNLINIANGNFSGIVTASNIGIGTTNPSSKLDLIGPSTQNIVQISASNIDCSLGNYFTDTVNGNKTYTINNVPSNRSYSFTIEINHTSGSITWFSGVQWPNGTSPTLTTGKTHLFMFITDDNGNRWRASSLANYTT